MDRQIVYPGSIPLDTDLLNVQRNTMIAIGYLAQATLGSGVVVDGLGCVPATPASLAIVIGPGSITQLSPIDSNSFGSLGADANDPLVKMGVNVTGLQFALQPPPSSGQAVNHLVQVGFGELDTASLVLPYYNAANPAQPFSGVNNTGTAQNTQRLQRVVVQVKPGVPAPAGSQVTPTADPGFTAIWSITVGYGAQQVTGSGIVQVPGAPFIGTKIPQLTPGYRNMAAFGAGSSGPWVTPNGIRLVKLRIWGGGGAGGTGNGGAAGGGSGGGFSEAYVGVQPGQAYQVTVANGGAAAGAAGGTSSFGNLASASGGGGGGSGSAGAGGAGSNLPGSGFGPGFGTAGSSGQSGSATSGCCIGGQGGGSFGNAGSAAVVGGTASSLSGLAGAGPGAGGSGGIGGGSGGAGGSGLVVVEW